MGVIHVNAFQSDVKIASVVLTFSLSGLSLEEHWVDQPCYREPVPEK